MVDLHVHLPQIPNAGLGAGLDLLTWLEGYISPLERHFDDPAAEPLAPAAWRAFASAGTTTALVYGAVYEASLDASFRAAEAHGIRAIVGKVMMDRSPTTPRSSRPTSSSSRWGIARLIARWHGADYGRLRYAVTPRFAISCSAEMLRESAALAASTGAYWQTHVSEDRGEILYVARLFPEALDYVDVYDRAGGLGARTVLAHAVHLSDRELGRLVETAPTSPIAPSRTCSWPPGSCLWGGTSGPASRGPRIGCRWGAGPLDLHGHAGQLLCPECPAGRRAHGPRPRAARLDPDGDARWARALGLGDIIGSLEAGKEADSSRSIRPMSRPSPASRRGQRPRQAPHLPVASRHGPWRLGPRPSSGGSGSPRLTRGPPESSLRRALLSPDGVQAARLGYWAPGRAPRRPRRCEMAGKSARMGSSGRGQGRGWACERARRVRLA